MNKYWYKNAVIYALDVESYLDLNGDGVGDFQGLKHALRYLSGLCINVLAHFCKWENNIALAIHNFGEEATDITLKHKSISFYQLIEIFSDDESYKSVHNASGKVHLNGFGYRWFRSNNL